MAGVGGLGFKVGFAFGMEIVAHGRFLETLWPSGCTIPYGQIQAIRSTGGAASGD
jgi:hypothetical protein